MSDMTFRSDLAQAQSSLDRAHEINRKIEAEIVRCRQVINNTVSVALILLMAAGTLAAKHYGI